MKLQDINVCDASVQDICRKLVEREVGVCVSTLVGHFASNPESLEGSDYNWEDDVLPLCQTEPDWEELLQQNDCEQFEDEYGVECWKDVDGMTWAGSAEEAAEAFGLTDEADEYRREVYEHWTVSDWFAEKLRERGETVGEMFGLIVWGRATTGQAIYMDHVIVSIAFDMGILPGQENSWAK